MPQAVSTTAEECVPAKTPGRVARPQLRGILASAAKLHTIAAFTLAIGACMAYRYYVGEPRKKKYAEFWRTYDSHADYKRMVKAGVFLPDYSIEDFEEYEQDLLKKLKAKKQ